MRSPVTNSVPGAADTLIRREFDDQNIPILDLAVRAYPEETNYIIYVREQDLARAVELGNLLDDEITSSEHPAFVVVRKGSGSMVEVSSIRQPLSDGVQDERATRLTQLITARSRVSVAQPSLSYIRDIESNLSAVTAGRHHLVFGRRGAGKSALLVEAMQQISTDGYLSCWINMQTLRKESPQRVFLNIIEAMLSTVVGEQQRRRTASAVAAMAATLYEQVQSLLLAPETPTDAADRIVPQVQKVMRRFLEQEGTRLYVFIDDFYFLPRAHQPLVLDMLVSCIRDCEAWLKVASIRHLTRWFQHSPPLGLQTTQDAELINLDVTLQDPKRAKSFLESILLEYCKTVSIGSLNRIFNSKALDRLVLASGAVPRDYLVLASSSIQNAQRREKAKLVGAQDVNQAAGEAMQIRIQELEEDMAANIESANRTIAALNTVRNWCLEERGYTYFLVDYRDKEENPGRYNVLTDLMSVRLVHLIDAGVSHAHAAGQRSEAFMLDLSQYSGLRLKQGIEIIDFESGQIVARRTRSATARRVGNTPREVIAILRVAPTLTLNHFEHIGAD